RGQSALEAVEPLPVPEHGEVLARYGPGARLHDLADLGALSGRGEAKPGLQALLNRGVASGPAEHEQDRRQQTLAIESVHNVRSRWTGVAPAPRRPPAAGHVLNAPGRFPGVAQQLRMDL